MGCGAGGTLCRVAPRALESWGLDQAGALLDVARDRLRDGGLPQVRLLKLNVVGDDLSGLPDAHFDLALTQRGPNFNTALVAKLRNGAICVQELVGSIDQYPLKEIFGRRAYAAYNFTGPDTLMAQYADLGLFPVSVKQYFYDQFFRDSDHLASYLMEGANLNNWRLPPMPFDAQRDRAALDLYVRYNTTPNGVRVLGQRWVFAFRKAAVSYYPAAAGGGA